MFSNQPWIAAATWLLLADVARFATRFADGEEGEYGTWAGDQVGAAALVVLHNGAFAALTLIVGLGLHRLAIRWSRVVALSLPAIALGAYLASGGGVQRVVPLPVGVVLGTVAVFASGLAAWRVLDLLWRVQQTRWAGTAQFAAVVVAAGLLVADRLLWWGLYLPLHLVMVCLSTGLIALASRPVEGKPHSSDGRMLLTAAVVAAVLGIVAVPVAREFAPAAHTRATTDGTGALQNGRIWYVLRSLFPHPLPTAQLAAGTHTPVPLEPRVRPHIVVVSLDGVRFDRTSLGGYANDTTPGLRRLAQTGWVYERAYAPAANTYDTLSRLFAESGKCTEHTTAIFEQARTQGYVTICDFAYSRKQLACFSKGCDAKLDSQDRSLSYRVAVEALTTATDPVFVFMHLLETHVPYRGFGRDVVDATPGWSDYDRAIRGADEAFYDFYQRVEAAVSRPVLWVVMSDHGEALGERGHRGHDSSVFAEQTWVPLVMHAQGIASSSVSDPVDVSWLRQTLLATVGLEARGGLPRTNPTQRPVFSANEGWRAVARDRWRYVIDDTSGASWLFDLSADPRELHDLRSSHPDIADDLAALLRD